MGRYSATALARNSGLYFDVPNGVRAGILPRTMASLPNLAISLFRQCGETHIAAALRHSSSDYRRPLTSLGPT